MTVIRWQPDRDFLTLREAMSRMFDDAIVGPLAAASGGASTIPFDVIERADEIVVRAPVPGFTPDDIDVNITGDVLTVTGNRTAEREEDEGNYHVREWRSGSFQRAMRLPSEVDPNKAEASVKDGVLTLTLPIAEAVKPKKISIKAN